MEIALYLAFVFLFPALPPFVAARLIETYRPSVGLAVIVLSATLAPVLMLWNSQSSDAISAAAAIFVVPAIFVVNLVIAAIGLSLGGLRK